MHVLSVSSFHLPARRCRRAIREAGVMLAMAALLLLMSACGGSQELGSSGTTSSSTTSSNPTPSSPGSSKMELRVIASGSVDAGNGGLMEVRVKSQPAGLVEVREATAKEFRFVLDETAPREDVDVVWLNPDPQGAPARSLKVESVQLMPATAATPHTAGTLKPAAGLALPGKEKPTSASSRALSCPGVSTSLVLRAAASPAAGVWPLVQVRADGVLVASLSVPSWSMADYKLSLPALAAGSRVDIVFTNDGWQGSDDRNLFVEWVSLNGQVLLPNSAGVVYDRGAIDGVDVINGQKALLWTGALRFPTPAAVAVASDCGGTTTPPPTASGGCAAGRFCEFAGLNVKFSQGQPLSELPTLPELGVRWVRDSVRASDVEPSPGRYAPFSAAVLQRLNYYRDKGIGLVFVMPLKNDVAYPATTALPFRPYDAPAYGRRAVEIARMLRAVGVKFVLEIGNEPHNELYRVMGGEWQGRLPSAWVTHYAAMVREAVRQVKAYDASVKLLADDDMWVVHYWFLEAGLPPDLDGLAVHPYTPTAPELAAVQYNTPWTAPFQVVDADNSMVSGIRRLKAQARSKWGREPEIWITEMGWPISGAQSVSESTLASYLPRFFVASAAAGVKGIQWFSSQDAVDGPMGLTANGGARRLPFQAYKTMTSQLGAYQLDGQILGAATPTQGVQAYAFSGHGDPLLMVWTADGVRRSLALKAGWVAIGASTALGAAPVVCAATATRGPAFSIGPEPVYVKLQGAARLSPSDLQVLATGAPC
jgi:Ca-dependent carbohydrate-binding module xylan-binding